MFGIELDDSVCWLHKGGEDWKGQSRGKGNINAYTQTHTHAHTHTADSCCCMAEINTHNETMSHAM